MTQGTHDDLIVEQFTRQAVPFSTAATVTNDDALRLLVQESAAGPADTVLDVACGGGVVVCHYARTVRHATGLDMTPAMLDRARVLAREKGVENVDWRLGSAHPLPYADGAFTIVATRLSFHHFLDPLAVMREMVRVCAPGGRVQVIDMVASDDAAKGAEFNRMERLRDPSHVRCLTESELAGLFALAGLPPPRVAAYELRDELSNLLARSFPNPGDDARIREIFAGAAEDDRLGIPVQRDGERLRYAYPVRVMTAVR